MNKLIRVGMSTEALLTLLESNGISATVEENIEERSYNASKTLLEGRTEV